ncbi:MAG: TRAP transporter fused permease subunit [Rhodospirillaceae bacterium]|jgi:TRAP transporter 4TM/12TM fusion protein|nr:TRAP transporter fused permease subunit [Rhodospirillaceae bacterium]
MTPSNETVPAPSVQPVAQNYVKIIAAIMTFGSLAWSADLYRDVGLVILLEQYLSGMLGLALTLVFLRYPMVRKSERTSIPWYDKIIALVAFLTGAYVAVLFEELTDRMIDGAADTVVVSAIFIVLSLEGLRRTTGYALIIIVGVFLFYAMVGHLVPGDLQTREVKVGMFTAYLGLDSSSLLGLPMVVGTTIVITFVFFGQLLLHSGGAAFFNDLSLALMGRYRGGSAKIAITASSLFGSISGVAVSNIVATGIVTIPMMKKAGFSPRLAASVEAVASTGGQLMPPVMGAVAFLMADFLELPYQSIVIAALVPAILYYVALFIQADLEAAKNGIDRVEEHLIPKFWDVMKAGWVFVFPFAALIYALFWLNWRAETAALLASGVVLVLGLFIGYKGQKMNLNHVWRSFSDTGNSVLDVLMIVAGAGFIIGTLQVTGLGFAFTLFIVEAGGDNLFLLLLIAAVLCIVLGMGMPTVGVYILLAILIAPSLVEVGVTPLAAHMFILYLGMMSLITPPVAVAAFFAASIAKAPPMATGWTCMRFGWTAYIVPFLFVFSPSLLLQGTLGDLIVDVSSAIAGVWLVSAGMIGYFARPMDLLGRAAFLTAGVLLLIPSELGYWVAWTDWIGWIMGALVVLWDISAARKQRAAA